MRRRPLILSLVAMGVAAAAALAALVAGVWGGPQWDEMQPRLGLDLRGGISAIYTPELPEGQARPDDFEQVLEETIEVIRQRVNQLGVAEPDISRQGDDVLVQLPGLEDPERAREVIGTTAQLSFRPVIRVVPPGSPAYQQLPECGTAVDPEQLGPLAPAPNPGATPRAPATPQPQSLPEGGGPSGEVVAAAETSPSPVEPGGASPSPSPTGEGGEGGGGVGAQLADEQAGVLCAAEDAQGAGADAGGGGAADAPPTKYIVGPEAVAGESVVDAFAALEQQGAGNWVVNLELDDQGGENFAEVTSRLACERDQGQPGLLAIVLDGRVESATGMNPQVPCGEGITGGEAQITMGRDDAGQQEQEARDLALVLKTGSLPISLTPSTFQTISPTLGAESLQAGVLAAAIGLALVALYLVFFYRWLGVVAIGALSLFGLLMYGLITLLGQIGFALTLAGIAGIVVSVGITADSSILFFERIRDEVVLGRTMRSGVKSAFEAAFRTNLAGNTVTLVAALVLYFLAVGPVRGFALTLGFATVLDIFILYFYTRPAVWLLSRRRGVLTRESIRAARPTEEPAVEAAGS